MLCILGNVGKTPETIAGKSIKSTPIGLMNNTNRIKDSFKDMQRETHPYTEQMQAPRLWKRRIQYQLHIAVTGALIKSRIGTMEHMALQILQMFLKPI